MACNVRILLLPLAFWLLMCAWIVLDSDLAGAVLRFGVFFFSALVTVAAVLGCEGRRPVSGEAFGFVTATWLSGAIVLVTREEFSTALMVVALLAARAVIMKGAPRV